MLTTAPLNIAYIGFGSNLGDRRATIESALQQLRETPGIQVRAVSSLLENAAVGGPADSPPFLNGVAELTTERPPLDLLDRLLKIERNLGRVRSERNAPRTIDLDLLLYGEMILQSESLVLPHPRMRERIFVLEPLAEIAPALRLPTGESVRELLLRLRATNRS
ncbi:MAG: 2-amino-4-hydroxy-6-hydroxymethyldihydropteridine diphosphokinase [Phycisphaerae bacterium]|nr:2-amino-4-hydroxy-6-hydroxymethyldihydropteridine diphosphokinase [Phycisphaerae bacterium]